MKTIKTLLLCTASTILLCLVPLAQAADSSIENHPGYVDFSGLTSIADSEPTVEISLRAPLLNMITNLIRAEDDMAANFISKLLRVTVNVFESDDIDVDQIAGRMTEIAANLDQQGWERVVSDDAEFIHGVAIMVAEPGDTVMVNIVGEISGDDIAALGRRFEIDELVDLEVD